MSHLSRTFASDLGQLSALREFLDEICRGAWTVEADDDALCQLELATHEAATNIIRHAYEGRPGQLIYMTVEADAGMARVTLRHNGREFDPASVPAPKFDGTRFGGFGVYLIGQLVDEVTYTRDDEGRFMIRLVKRRPAQRGAGAGPAGRD
jgi:serine/threonine-protein kinase RsbW